MAEILDGKRVARSLRENIKHEVSRLSKNRIRPKFVVLLVGNNAASKVYVDTKRKIAAKIGIECEVVELPAEAGESIVVKQIAAANANPNVHGIVLQIPLPENYVVGELLSRIDPLKDVDCLTPRNVGLLAQGMPLYLPPTPAGIIELLKFYGITTTGKHVVIIGKGMLVGRPLALTLMLKGEMGDATVTVCHKKTKNLAGVTRQADILISATGQAGLVSGDYIKKGAVVIDVGMSKTKDGWVGDVKKEAAAEVAGKLTPVPGGVGPLTVMMLLSNVVKAAGGIGGQGTVSSEQ